MIKRIVSVVLLFSLLGIWTGCEQPLFPKYTPRSQYERFSAQRDDGVAPSADPFQVGISRAELRQRLSPIEED